MKSETVKAIDAAIEVAEKEGDLAASCVLNGLAGCITAGDAFTIALAALMSPFIAELHKKMAEELAKRN